MTLNTARVICLVFGTTLALAFGLFVLPELTVRQMAITVAFFGSIAVFSLLSGMDE